MTDQFITDKSEFIKSTTNFFLTMFDVPLKNDMGEIEIRIFPNGYGRGFFYSSETDAAESVYNLCNQGIDVYFGVNPRTGKGGKKDNVHYVSSFHAEIDYGSAGHKKEGIHKTYEDALSAIKRFPMEPTSVVHSGGGFHCYWALSLPLNVEKIGLKMIESINKGLSAQLGGDGGTHDISRVLRVPSTFNFKLPDNPRPVTLISNSGGYHSYEKFLEYAATGSVNQKTAPAKNVSLNQFANTTTIIESQATDSIDIENLPVSDRIKFLIKNGNDDTYATRSEADMAVITALVNKGVSESNIKKIFLSFPIGEKYRGHNAPDNYLKHSMDEARKKSELTEEEMLNPLFVSGAINKSEKGHLLDILKFQEYAVKKYRLKIFESTFYMYNGRCYGTFTDEELNQLCQKELSKHRKLFTKSIFKDFIHYAIGDALMENEKGKSDQVNYLTMQNGLYDLNNGKIIPHSPDIFTTNLLPYNYDPKAACPTFLKYLNDVFRGDKDIIEFIQEAMGYGFHKSIPMPAIFFLVGDGSNGKSVFINTITNLYGEENTCNINFTSLTNEYYLLGLLGKMINISSETPQGRQVNTDTIKAVVAGDWVTGRVPYKQPTKFRPYAKHYLAMNKIPYIDDMSHGMWRRIYIIDFSRKFSKAEMDVDLTDKLKGELSGIFNWAMEGYKRLKANRFRFKEVTTMEKSKQKYKVEGNNVLSFSAEYLKRAGNPDGKVKFSDVYKLYQSYCQTEGIKKPYTKKEFRKLLAEAGYLIENSKKDGNQVYLFGTELSGHNL